MTTIHHIRQANQHYAASDSVPEGLSAEPSRRVSVLTCMDCRLDPSASLGLDLGAANVVRNAGGRASDDAIRSLAVSTRLLGAREICVIHHSDCGMESKTQEGVVAAIARQDPAAEEAAREVDWLCIDAQPQALTSDVEKVKASPLIADDVIVHGMIQDPSDGSLTEVITL